MDGFARPGGVQGDPDSFTHFRPYLAHFFPVFSRFLRVFTVSTRRFQRAPSRNPGPRNSRQAPAGGLRFRLDPFATGALTLLLGKATRLTEVVLSGDKTYIAILKIDSSISSKQVEEVLERFSGEVYNVPPLESAVKIRVRTRVIQEIKLLESDQEDGLHTVSVSCQAGTYIRTLARDIGLMLGTPCVLSELHRHSTGSFEQSSLCTMQQLADAAMLAEEGDEEALCRLIAPVERILGSIPGVWVRDSAIASICHGAPLAVPGVVSLDSGMSPGDKTVIWSSKGEAVAVGEMIVGSSDVPNMTEGELIKPKIVLMDKDEYPGAWSGR